MSLEKTNSKSLETSDPQVTWDSAIGPFVSRVTQEGIRAQLQKRNLEKDKTKWCKCYQIHGLMLS